MNIDELHRRIDDEAHEILGHCAYWQEPEDEAFHDCQILTAAAYLRYYSNLIAGRPAVDPLGGPVSFNPETGLCTQQVRL